MEETQGATCKKLYGNEDKRTLGPCLLVMILLVSERRYPLTVNPRKKSLLGVKWAEDFSTIKNIKVLPYFLSLPSFHDTTPSILSDSFLSFQHS